GATRPETTTFRSRTTRSTPLRPHRPNLLDGDAHRLLIVERLGLRAKLLERGEAVRDHPLALEPQPHELRGGLLQGASAARGRLAQTSEVGLVEGDGDRLHAGRSVGHGRAPFDRGAN